MKFNRQTDKPGDVPLASNRLDGLDVARYLALVGMVIVNFKIAMGAEGGDGLINVFGAALQGRAAATFVVLAGIGLGLSTGQGRQQASSVFFSRAVFLLILGLLNMLIFDADILHYYAFYFLFGVWLLPLGTRSLIAVVLGLNMIFVLMLFVFDYDSGWNWENYTYQGFWTARGFVRNLFFNGWHPVIPWLGFLLSGVALSRLTLHKKQTQHRLIGLGVLAIVLAEVSSAQLQPVFYAVDPELIALATTDPIPPTPLYMLAGLGAASAVVGLCLRFSDALRRCGVLAAVAPAGRQTLTLYIAHIVLGMGTLETLGLLGNQSAQISLLASLVFCLLATLYALLWSCFFRRGPIEMLMRKLAG